RAVYLVPRASPPKIPTIKKSAFVTASKATRAAASTKAAYRPSTNACVDPVTTAGIVTMSKIAHQVSDVVRPARLAIDAEMRRRARKVVKFQRPGDRNPPKIIAVANSVSPVCGIAVWQLSGTGRITPSRIHTFGPSRWYDTASIDQSPVISAKLEKPIIN